MSSKSYQHAVLNEADDDKKQEMRMINFKEGFKTSHGTVPRKEKIVVVCKYFSVSKFSPF